MRKQSSADAAAHCGINFSSMCVLEILHGKWAKAMWKGGGGVVGAAGQAHLCTRLSCRKVDVTAESSLNGKTLVLIAWLPGASTAAFTLTSTAGDIVVSGADNKVVTITGADTKATTAAVYRYVLRNTTDDSIVARGTITVEAALDVPATP